MNIFKKEQSLRFYFITGQHPSDESKCPASTKESHKCKVLLQAQGT
jgi:hypothetical protein